MNEMMLQSCAAQEHSTHKNQDEVSLLDLQEKSVSTLPGK